MKYNIKKKGEKQKKTQPRNNNNQPTSRQHNIHYTKTIQNSRIEKESNKR